MPPDTEIPAPVITTHRLLFRMAVAMVVKYFTFGSVMALERDETGTISLLLDSGIITLMDIVLACGLPSSCNRRSGV